MSRLALLLAAGCSLTAGEVEFGVLVMPAPHLTPDGVVAANGFVGRLNGRTLMADALRYDRVRDDLYATGNVVFRLEGVRLACSRLGAHPNARRGEAWEVEAMVDTPDGRRLVFTADRVAFDEGRATFRGVRLDMGAGSVVSFWTPRIEVQLRPRPDPTREGPAERVEAIEMFSPTARLFGVPVFWLPWMARDYRLDYPWTRFRWGSSKRLGKYLRFWTGSSLPELFGWRSDLTLRGERATHAGDAFGAGLRWGHPRFGLGGVTWLHVPSERLRGDPTLADLLIPARAQTDREELDRRHARAIDASHQANLGAGALALRWMRTPYADPVDFTAVPNDLDPGLRFLADRLPEELASQPYPRRSAALSYGFPLGSVTYDLTRRYHHHQDTTERWHALQAQLVPFQLAGPLHLAGEAWGEDLHRLRHETSATRLRAEGRIELGQWFGGLGLDARAGVRHLQYTRGWIAGVEQSSLESRRLGFLDAGLSLRFAAELGEGVDHTLLPRLGVQILGKGVGDVLPTYGFGDSRDTLEEDKRLATLGFETSITGPSAFFTANALSRWALRDEERQYRDDAGALQLAPRRLVDLALSAQGSPWTGLTLTASALYDARLRRWQSVNGGLVLTPVRWLELRESATLIPDSTATPRLWQNEFGGALIAHRYRFETLVTTRPGGGKGDRWNLALQRKLVEGELGLRFEIERDDNNTLVDRRWSVDFTLGGDQPPRIGEYAYRKRP